MTSDGTSDGRRAGRPAVRRLTAVWLGALALLLATSTEGQVRAQQGGAAGWEPTGLASAVRGLFAPASGGLFARTEDGLLRSDDAGTTWAPVRLPPGAAPPGPRLAAVDPTNHRVWYVPGAEGLYKSEDDAVSWRLVLPLTSPDRVEAIAVSPPTPDVVYVALVRPQVSLRFLRSRDGGTTWEELEQAGTTLCSWGVPLLSAHPTDASRVFRAAVCYAGRWFGSNLRQSRDQGATWQDLLGLATRRVEGRTMGRDTGYPVRLVGGQGAAPRRWYVGAVKDSRIGGSLVFHSDDDGSDWQEILGFTGGGTDEATRRALDLGADAPNVQLGGLVYDPAQPDRLYVGLNDCLGDVLTPRTCTGRVLTSADGGLSWPDVGGRTLARITDLALGIDGRNLYAATDEGLRRVPIAR
jgi:photosystem II stability/assembly factor-like uncharacterized protein